MEAGGKDCEEETLQTAFKKLRVDAESLPGPVSVSDALVPRSAARAGLDVGGAKPKLSCPKDNWHGCSRKSSRGASRTQRRRRSKSPILHPPKFTYCSSGAASSLSTSSLKQQRLAMEAVEPRPTTEAGAASPAASPAQNELCSSSTAGYASPLVFGSQAAYKAHLGACLQDTSTAVVASPPRQGGDNKKSACVGAELEAGAPQKSGNIMDFRALSELHGLHPPCCCVQTDCSPTQVESLCRCQGTEVYSFTGLRDVISECERSPASHIDTPRTLGTPRSCSEQARAYVDDVTIEDLSGYMEFYLYIPKKMSHMAEMMYT